MSNENSFSKIDKNFSINTTIKEPDIAFYDVRREPFEVYGLYDYRNEPDFKRIPDEVAKRVSEGVANLNYQTAGGRVRFCTDSRYVAIHADMTFITRIPHNSLVGCAAFDLYVDDPITGESTFYKPFIPDMSVTDKYESVIGFSENKMRYFTICFPAYSNVRNLYIGLQEMATVGEGMKYRDVPPVVYYGSSITQGGCASHSGNIYQNIICRRMNMDYIDLGFSGNGKGEDEMVDYMAGLEMSVFVCNYDHNAPNVEHLRNTHLKMYKKIREKHPDIPYIMLSCPGLYNRYDQLYERREVIHDTYRFAREQGDKRVYFIDGEQIFAGQYRDLCLIDGVHPTDVGFALMANVIGDTIKRAFAEQLMR
ncbi:MAG: hypothetical protein J6U86_01985 [Clostridia bacterium]|nr:hypothetical protein [Clostridia bacterium]